MSGEPGWARLGGGLIALLALLALGLALLPAVRGAAGGPHAEVLTALARTEREGLSVPVPGVPEALVSREHHFGRVTVVGASAAGTLEAVATLDFSGTLGATEVGSLGVERVPFVRRGAGWALAGSAAPRLAAALGALEAYRRALEAADAQGLTRLRADGPPPADELAPLEGLSGRRLQVEAWRLRLERDEVLVSERWRLTGVAAHGGEVERRGERPRRLVPCGEGFCIGGPLR